MKTITTLLLCAICCTSLFAQNGLEGIIVEKYYVSNANDATVNATGGVLPVGSVTYRIYVDLLPGYKFQAAYGIPGHELRLHTTTTFFNNEYRGQITPGYTKSQAANNTVMLDSWLSAGAACVGNFGVLKSEDNGVANVVNTNGVLQNNDPSMGIPLTSQDGFIIGAPQDVTRVGIDLEETIFDATNAAGNLFSTSNGSWASLNGSTGPNANNKVLIAQMTTDGVFSFKLNIQIGTPLGGIQNYVAENPIGSEIQMPSLSFTSLTTVPMNVKAFLEGYYLGGGLMNAAIDPVNLPNIADTVIIQLASASTPYSVQFTQKTLMSTTGNISMNVPAALTGNSLYLIVKHRNSIETWSASPVLITTGFTYDFTNAINKSYGNNLLFLGDGNFAIFSGDISDAGLAQPGFQDGVIESQDYQDEENAVSSVATGYIPQDITGDGVVESADYLIMENNVSALIFTKRP